MTCMLCLQLNWIFSGKLCCVLWFLHYQKMVPRALPFENCTSCHAWLLKDSRKLVAVSRVVQEKKWPNQNWSQRNLSFQNWSFSWSGEKVTSKIVFSGERCKQAVWPWASHLLPCASNQELKPDTFRSFKILYIFLEMKFNLVIDGFVLMIQSAQI